jgi:hypothetical protein
MQWKCGESQTCGCRGRVIGCNGCHSVKGKIARAGALARRDGFVRRDRWLQEDGNWLQFARDGSGESMMLAWKGKR